MADGPGNYLDESSLQPIPNATNAQPNIVPIPAAKAGVTPKLDPVTARHSTIGRIFETLAGGARTETAIDPETGATIERKVPLKPGEMARNILSAALTGMIAGGAERGPGAASRAFSKGGTAVVAQKEKQQQQDREKAQQEFKNRQLADEATLRKHADARQELERLDRLKESGLRMQAIQLGLDDAKYDHAKKHADDMIQYYAEADLVKSLGGKPVEGLSELTDEDFFKKGTTAIHGSVPGSFGGIPVRDPGTGTITVYEIPDKEKPLSKEEVAKANSLLGIDLKPGVNTRGELMSYFLRPQNAELVTKRMKEQFELKEAELKVEETKERIGLVKEEAARARAKATKESAKEKENKELEETLTDLADPEKADKIPKGKRDKVAMTIYAMVSKAHTALKDATKAYTDNPTPENKEEADSQKQQMDYWQGLQNQLHGVKPKSAEVKPITIYGPNGATATVDSDKVDQAIADAKATGHGEWFKPQAPVSGKINMIDATGRPVQVKPEEVESAMVGGGKVAPESQAAYDTWYNANKKPRQKAVGEDQK